MNERRSVDIAETFASDEKVIEAIKEAVAQDLERHKSKGNRVAVWRDGKPVWISPTPEPNGSA